MQLLKKRKFLSDLEIHDFNDRANILLCSDKNVIRGLGVTIVSVLENMTMPCAIHIAFNGELPAEEEGRLTQLAKKYKVPFCIYWIDDSSIQRLNSNSYITVTAYYRLLMPYIMQEFDIKRCLYLDTDILCVDDISEWYVQPLDNVIAAVSKDATSQPGLRESQTCRKLGMKGLKYFNSGILLINLNSYVKSDIGKKAIELCAEQKFGEMDQDVLNILLEGQVHFNESYAYNCGMSARNSEVPERIYLVHFTGAKKPWKLCTSELNQGTLAFFDEHSWKYAYYAFWRKYANISPWAKVPFDEPKNYREWRYLSNMYFKNGKIRLGIKTYFKYLSYKWKS
ncbi:glycosyltransferase family 8 protein [Veillonella ratti]|uniref:glycosyltransferase family 8 protein n=1 Tax=Veillonella ratti TaxID=103892 RepID=UPI000F8EED39|nr:glycosyltransferase [Veillonella ratti]